MSSINTQNGSELYQDLGLSNNLQAKSNMRQSDMGQEDFLTLMTTQLKNQDPFKPMESGEFLSQIAQFGTVRGINELKESFGGVASSLHSNQALQASSLVGRDVQVPTDDLDLPNEGGAAGTVDLTASVPDLTITVRNAVGEVVRRIDMGSQAAGQVPFQWDGLRADGSRAASGRYSVTAEGRVGQQPTAFSTMVVARVESVTLERGGGMQLNLRGLGPVSFDEVARIQ
jgi:flagellar basal-body rod modification protein FlgD